MREHLQTVAVVVAIGGSVSGLIASAAILHYRVGQLEDDKVLQIEKRIDATSERISNQWRVIADNKERIVKLETRAEQ